jgi:hypothetical protein
MDGKPSWPAEARVYRQLDHFASRARQIIASIDALSEPAIGALDAAGWNSGQTFALLAELAWAAECAERARGWCRDRPETPHGARDRLFP